MSSRRPLIRRRHYPPEPPAADREEAEAADLLDLPLGDSSDQTELGFDSRAGESAGPGEVADSAPPVSPRSAPRRRDPRSEQPPRRGSRWPWLLFVLLLPLAAVAGFLLRPLPPVASISQDLIDFGEIRLGSEEARQLRVQNDGESPLELISVEIMDDPGGIVRRVEGTCGDRALAPAEGCELVFLMAPTAVGPARARLRLVTNAPSGERTVPMIGRGVAPAMAVEPGKLEFGEVTVGERGGRGQVRLFNRGSASLRVESVDLQGLAAADFVRFDDRCSTSDLEPGGMCTVGFEFVPTAAGVRRARVRIAAESPAPQSTELVGTGLPQLPVLALSPDRLDFGSLRLGDTSEVASVELRNDGNGPLDIRAVRVTVRAENGDVGGSLAASFPLEDVGCAGRRLDPGGACRLLATFEPKAEGVVGAVVEIEHSAAPGVHRLPVVGTGVAPRAVLSPRQLGFGEVPVGSESHWRRLEIGNSGSAELRIGKVSLRGADARSFQISAEGCLRTPIPPGQECSVEVRFRARRDGPHRAEIHLRHDAGDGFDLLPINGLGTSARLGLDPVALDFGDVQAGTTRRLDLTLRNTGRAPLTLRRLSFADGDGLALDKDCSGAVLPAGGTCLVAVRLAPGRPGSIRDRLIIEHDSSGSPRDVAIQAVVRPRPRPQLTAESGRLRFSERYITERSPIQSLTLRNTGDARLDVRETEIEGPEAGDFQLVPGSCADFVPAGTSCTVGVAFAPTAAGVRRATLTIRHNAEGGVLRVELEGVGVGL